MDVSTWLQGHMLATDAYDAKELLADFLAEMEKGLKGDTDSLAMLPAYVHTQGTVPVNKPVAVIDAGGTNLRTCLAEFNEKGGVDLSHFSKRIMLGRDCEITAAEFYAVLVDALEPMKDDFENVGFCFSFPIDVTPNYDGRLLRWTKDIKIPDLVGKNVGEGLVRALEERGICGKKVVVLNDTVAALLAGLAHGKTFDASSYIGVILGTGTNTSYVEQNEKIGKLEGFLGPGSQVINVESGGFKVFSRGALDRQLDERSENPGGNIFEKAISGAYMGHLTLLLLQELALEDVFSASGRETLSMMKELSTVHIDNLTSGNGGDIGILGAEVFTDEDRELMKPVFRAVVDRAALLTAVNIMAAVVKSGVEQNQDRPICVNIDGSTYYKTHGMAKKVNKHLSAMQIEHGVDIRCIQVDDASVVGAAIAGLTTFQ